MFAKFKSTRTPATPAAPPPQFKPELDIPSASKKSYSFSKRLLRVKKVFHCSSVKKDVYSQDISQRRQGVSEHSHPLQGITAVADDNPAELDRRLYLRSPVEPAQSPALLNSSPRLQPGLQSPISSTAHRSNFSATASPLLAPPHLAATTSATSFVSTHPFSHCSKQPAAPHSNTSLGTSSPLAPLPSIATAPATAFVPPCSASQYSAFSATPPRSRFAPKISSPLAQFVVTAPATTFSPARSPPSTTSRATCPLDASPLFVPPQWFAATSVATPPAFSSFQCSNSGSDLSSSKPPIADVDLEEIDAPLNRQYNAGMRGAHPMIRHRVYSRTKSRAYITEKAKEELDEVLKQVAALDMECLKLKALLQDECNKFAKVEEGSNKAQWKLEEADEEHAELQFKAPELQAGQATYGVWVIEPLERYSQPSQPVVEHMEEERYASPAGAHWSQRAKKVLRSWGSPWNARIAGQRSSGPCAIPTATKSDEEDRLSESDQGNGAKSAAPYPSRWMKHGGPGFLVGGNQNGSNSSVPQGPVAAPNGSKRQTKDAPSRDARRVETSHYNDKPLRWGQVAPDSAVRARNHLTHSSRHA